MMNSLNVSVLREMALLESDDEVTTLDELMQLWLHEKGSKHAIWFESDDMDLGTFLLSVKHASNKEIPFKRINSSFVDEQEKTYLRYRDNGEDFELEFTATNGNIDDEQITFVGSLVESLTQWRLIDLSDEDCTIRQFLCVPKEALV